MTPDHNPIMDLARAIEDAPKVADMPFTLSAEPATRNDGAQASLFGSGPATPAAPSPDGPRYTIAGDFHYCTIVADSSSRGSFRVAVACNDSPGAEPGEDWRAEWEDVLWLIPCECTQLAPFDVAMRAMANWYDDAGLCLCCGSADCHGGCYPEYEPIKAQPAEMIDAWQRDGRNSTCCWCPRTTCYDCGEHSRCSGCDTCYNRACPTRPTESVESQP